MSALTTTLARLRGLDLERALGLRPPCPTVALEVQPRRISLVRIKRRRRQPPLLEAYASRELGEETVPASIFQQTSGGSDELPAKLSELFDAAGTRPTRLSLVLPDNLAKVSLLRLPERPASRKQLEELVRAKMRRAVPFRLEEASLAYELLTGEGREVVLLVVLARRGLIERFERPLDALGARVGLVDICTPNLLNLYRERVEAASRSGGDAALLNCARNYFSLAIVRGGRLIFFRCKTFALGDPTSSGPNGMLAREMSSSFSYYREKLAGEGVKSVIVRNVTPGAEDLEGLLRELGCESVEPLVPTERVELGEGVRLDPETGLSIAAALGAALGRVG
jgi:hypothetical protein